MKKTQKSQFCEIEHKDNTTNTIVSCVSENKQFHLTLVCHIFTSVPRLPHFQTGCTVKLAIGCTCLKFMT